MSRSSEVRSDRWFTFAAPIATVWVALGRVDLYRHWWPWLRSFDAQGLVQGDRWSCEVRPPLPYTLRFELALDALRPLQSIDATLTGDLVGSAHLELTGRDGATDVHLVSRLAAAGRVAGALTVAMRPLARYGHDWILATGARQFATRALAPGSSEQDG